MTNTYCYSARNRYISFNQPINKCLVLRSYYLSTLLHTLIHPAIDIFLENKVIDYRLNLFHFFFLRYSILQISIHRAKFQHHILPKDHSFIRLHIWLHLYVCTLHIHRLYHRPNVLRKHRHQRDKKSPFHEPCHPFKSLRIELYQARYVIPIHHAYRQFIRLHK